MWRFVLKGAWATAKENAAIWENESKGVYYWNLLVELILATAGYFVLFHIAIIMLIGVAMIVKGIFDSINVFHVIAWLLSAILIVLLIRK